MSYHVLEKGDHISVRLDGKTLEVASERLQEIFKAEQEGRLVALDDETALALAAVVRGCNTNRKLVGASYMWDICGELGGPKTISYYKAITLMREIADKAMKEEV